MLTDLSAWKKANADHARWVARRRPELVEDSPTTDTQALRYLRDDYHALQPSPVWGEMLQLAMQERAKMRPIEKAAHELVKASWEAEAEQRLRGASLLGDTALGNVSYDSVSHIIPLNMMVMPDDARAITGDLAAGQA